MSRDITNVEVRGRYSNRVNQLKQLMALLRLGRDALETESAELDD
jgi:hypothetical protein